jgi:23S rRNA pseudouridine1911/1915/1917 synthase
MNKNEMIVSNEDTLLNYLLTNIKNKSKNNIKTLLKNNNIFVNNKSTTKYDYPLKKGDIIEIRYSVEVNDRTKIDIIYEDDDIIVINKPAGLLSIATDNEKEMTAYSLVSSYLKNRNKNSKVFIIHRIDKDTSGVLMLSKKESIKDIFQDNWNDIVKKRGYIAVVEGKITKDGTVKSWLKETKTNLVYSSNREGDGKEAITNYHVIKSNDNYSLLEVDIKTGRKNQIRVHMKDINHSIIGDKKYGSTIDPLKRLGLHANVLELIHPLTKKTLHFETQVPSNFYKLFKK